MTRLGRPLRAVLFDMDGTLYRQQTLRLFMALELASLPMSLGSLSAAGWVWKTLRVFRRVREELRGRDTTHECLANLQYTQAADRLGVDPLVVRQAVEEWMFHRPLKYLRRCRGRGSAEFFAWCSERHLRLGIFSDYPAREKLRALGLADRAWPVLCATDPEINAFKPHPRGFLRACGIWGLAPDEVLYVGDRKEIDAAGAAAAGMPSAILCRRARIKASRDFKNRIDIASFTELRHVLIDHIKR